MSLSESFEETVSESTDKSTVSNDLSDWEDGILTVNSILMQGSPVYEALTKNQIDGLLKVQQILLRGDADKSKHVPVRLNSMGSKRDVYDTFLLSEYAGIEKVSRLMSHVSRPKPRWSCIREISTATGKDNDHKDSYEPEEWTILA
eukprot:CAMPEP_0194280596 /NCGR_PEP_ID=MMETSP0169-20130528/17980_1 /TAXON_ID=218684 /ORGANISM="Corethron pennatum, Strain L29A3" /LENGTH=145 /DNA_ID=CAMNT_0039025373 /DNA_START=144 /DNA_END=578 /DNA_ORIENTATION=+